MAKWRSMKSCKKDQNIFYIFLTPHDGCPQMIGRWDEEEQTWVHQIDDAKTWLYPHRWMPLPHVSKKLQRKVDKEAIRQES